MLCLDKFKNLCFLQVLRQYSFSIENVEYYRSTLPYLDVALERFRL